MLVEDQKLDAVISLPGGVFKPYAGVSTAILLFTKTNSGGTDHVWFYDVEADGCRSTTSARRYCRGKTRSHTPPEPGPVLWPRCRGLPTLTTDAIADEEGVPFISAKDYSETDEFVWNVKRIPRETFEDYRERVSPRKVT